MKVEVSKRNPILAIIPDIPIHPELKVSEFFAKVKSYAHLGTQQQQVNVMLQTLLECENPYYKESSLT